MSSSKRLSFGPSLRQPPFTLLQSTFPAILRLHHLIRVVLPSASNARFDLLVLLQFFMPVLVPEELLAHLVLRFDDGVEEVRKSSI